MIRSIFICLALSLVFASWSQAQATNDPYPIIYQHLYHARYPQAIALASATLDQYKSDPQSNNYANALALGGWVQQNMDKFRPADSLLSAAIAIYEKNGATADSNYLKACSWFARVCSFTGKFQRADSILQKANAAAARCVGTPHAVHQATVLAQRFWLDIDRNKYKEASLKHAELIALLEKQWGKRHPRVAMALLETAKGLSAIWEPNLLEVQLLRAKNILEPYKQLYPQEYSSLLIELASTYEAMSQYPKREQLLLNCQAFIRSTLGTQHPQYAFVLRHLGSHYQYYTSQFKRAKLLYLEGLHIYSSHFGPQYGAYIGTLRDLSGWYGALGKVDSASNFSNRAYQLTRITYGEESYSFASLSLDYAQSLQDKGQQLAADSLFNTADSLCKKLFNGTNKLEIEILDQRAKILFWQGENLKSNVVAKTAYKKREELYGRNAHQAIKGSLDLAGNYRWTGFPKASDSLYQQGLSALKKIRSVMSFDYAFALSNYTYTLKKLDDIPKAKQYLQESTQIFQQLMGEENSWVVTNLSHLIDMQIRQKDIKGAELSLARSEAIIKKIYGDTSLRMKYLLDNRLSLFQETKIPIEQIELDRQIVDLERALGGSILYPQNLASLALKFQRNGENAKAVATLQEAFKHANRNGIIYLTILSAAINIALAIDDYTTAQQYLDEWKAILNQMGNPKDEVEYHQSKQINYLSAIGKYREALQVFEKQVTQPGYVMEPGDYNQWGICLQNLENYAKADSVLRVGIQLAEQNGESVPTMYGNLAVGLSNQGKYQEELDLYPQILASTIKKNGYISNETSNQLINLSLCLKDLDRLQEAEDTLYRVLEIQKKMGNNAITNRILHGLSVIHHAQNRYQLAESEVRQVLDGAQQRLGDSHPTTLHYRQSLAHSYESQEKQQLADSLYQAILAIKQQKIPGTTDHARILLLYGTFLSRVTGEYDRALILLQQGLAIMQQIFPNGHPDFGEFYVSLGDLYFNQADYTKALKEYQKAESVYDTFLGKGHTYYAMSQRKEGDVLLKMKLFEEAEKKYLRALTISEKLGPNNFASAITLDGLKKLYELKGEPLKAEAAIVRALQIIEHTRGKKSTDYAKIAVRMASLLYRKQDTLRANTLLAEAQGIMHDQIKILFTQIAPSRQSNVMDGFAVLDCYPTLLEEYPNDTLASMCFDNTLLVQGSILDNTRSLRQSILSTGDTTLLHRFDDYLAAEVLLTDAQKNLSQQPDSIEVARQKVQTLEENLRRKSPDFEQYSKSFELTWRDVQKALQPDEAAVMYLSYKHYRVELSDSVRYAAMVLRPGWAAPRFFPLVMETAIEDLVADNAQRGTADALTIYKHRGTSELTKPSVYEMIWKPLELALQGAKKVYFTPTGLLHRFNIGALPIKKGENEVLIRLQDRYDTLVQMRSLRHLIQTKELGIPTKGANRTALLVGKVDFGTSSKITWPTLGDETPYCNDSLTQRQYKVNYLRGSEASVPNVLKALQKSPPPSIIHFAVHGFFAPDLNKKSSKLSAASNPSRSPNTRDAASYLPKAWESYPLMRSGLVLAGANNLDSTTLKAGKNPYVITAQDIAALNLKGTDLVILSACETGLGDVVNNEGVYGLQRAFLQAGAKQVIMSLWKVDDDKTRKFMRIFYMHLSSGKTPRQALLDTQLVMRWDEKAGIKEEEFPYEWAAFVLIE